MTNNALLQPLAITCTSSDCENDLHCFLQKKRQRGLALRRGGACRSCGADLVSWERVLRRDLDDVAYTFEALKKELIRHEFWHRSIDLRALNHARRKGRENLREAIRHRVQRSVGGARNAREGRQTPMEGNVIYYAQHAVAACCRKCIEYWHGIPHGRELLAAETEYLVALIALYVDERIPDLADGPTKVRAIRSQ